MQFMNDGGDGGAEEAERAEEEEVAPRRARTQGPPGLMRD